MFTFEGIEKKCSLKVFLRVHSPQFYWKVTRVRFFFPSLVFIEQLKKKNVKEG